MANIRDGSNFGDKKTLQVLREVQLALTNIFARMPSLEHGNNRDNYRGDITQRQPISKQISYRPYKRIESFNGYFYKVDFLDQLLDLEDLFDYENIRDERKVKLVLYKLREYTLCWWEQIQTGRIRQGKDKIRSWARMKNMLPIKFYPLDCDEFLWYTKQDYFWPRSSHFYYFGEPYILPLKEDLFVEQHIFS